LSEPRDLELFEFVLSTKLLDLDAHLVDLLLHRGHLPAQHRDDVQQLFAQVRFNVELCRKFRANYDCFDRRPSRTSAMATERSVGAVGLGTLNERSSRRL
jgi:hypothetical protein